MKKILIIITCLCLLTACKTKENESEKTYNFYIEELKNVENEKVNENLTVKFIIEKLDNNYLSYNVLIDKNDLVMNEVEALLIHNKQSVNSFPSIGIFDKKISLNESTKKGIKLGGYLERVENATFKLLVKYKNKEGKNEKYYYIYKFHQNLTK